MLTKIITSPLAEQILTTVRYNTKIDFNVLGKIAISRSLTFEGDFSMDEGWKDRTGRHINLYSLIGQDELLYRSVFGIKLDEKITDDSFVELIKYHLERGLRILQQDLFASKNDMDVFIKTIAQNIITRGEDSLSLSNGLRLYLGNETLSDNQVYLAINDTHAHSNSHVAITGIPGSGKTQVLLNLLHQIRKQSNFATNFVFFDYKGEFLDHNREIVDPIKAKFIHATKAQIIQLPFERVPINPFVLTSYSEDNIKISVEEKADSFSSIDRSFGPVQKENLVKIIRKAYEKRLKETERYPDFDEVFAILKNDYDEMEKKEDTLYSMIRRLSELHLFWSHSDKSPLIKELYKKSIIIDLSKLPALKELVAYLIIEQLYKEMDQLPEVVPVNGIRPLRTILVIDEAHNYLPQKNIFLQKIIRQGRSKGIAVFFASQSPSDYEQKEFDFKELLEFMLIFKTTGLATKSLQYMYGFSPQLSNDLQQKVANFSPFECLTKLSSSDKGYAIVKAQPLFEAMK